jgi:pyridoxamine 5'-phosphate oxidase
MLLPNEVTEDPFETFDQWIDKARTAQIYLYESMALATASKKGIPSVRMVLLKGWDKKGFKFYTNYNSRKAQELIKNPHASLCFHWAPIERQVRIEGAIEMVSKKDSQDYHASRPRGSQIAAWASEQSSIIKSREQLLSRYDELEEQFSDKPVKCPPHWGGFRVVPNRIEFWLGRLNRFHERVVFERKKTGKWSISLLAP